MARIRLSWVGGFVAAVLIHVMVLAALSWKTDSDESALTSVAGSTVSLTPGTSRIGDAATPVAPADAVPVFAVGSDLLLLEPEVTALPPAPRSARTVHPVSEAPRAPVDSETVPPRMSGAAIVAAERRASAPHEVTPAAPLERAVLLEETGTTVALAPVPGAWISSTAAAPRPPEDAETVHLPRARTAAGAENRRVTRDLAPRESVPSAASDGTALPPVKEAIFVAPGPARAAAPEGPDPEPPRDVETAAAKLVGSTPVESRRSAIAVAPREAPFAAMEERAAVPALEEMVVAAPPSASALAAKPTTRIGLPLSTVATAVAPTSAGAGVGFDGAAEPEVPHQAAPLVAAVEGAGVPAAGAETAAPVHIRPVEFTAPVPVPQSRTVSSRALPEPETGMAAVPKPAAIAGATDAQALSKAGVPGRTNAGVAPLAIDLTGGAAVPEGWAGYLRRLQTLLYRHREYPRSARFRGQEGTAVLRFVIDRDGRLRDYGIEKGSGHELLDRAVIEMIERAEPLPPIPRRLGRNKLALTVPVKFVLR